ncbi:MAG: DoxX family membrane protein [Schleiferiaceae bacterium]|nr:DoxX family membrane protein [Schleiferiaceae bacterium]
MRKLLPIARLLVGLLFIFSGLIKLNDPLGFSYKLDEYFAANVLNLPFLQPFSLELALFVVILEVLLGVALLLGFWRRLTAWLLLGMIVFFTFLTFYSAYFNKVTDCGCFGDAIPLTPWESFFKDLVLLVLILIIFTYRNSIRPFLDRPVNAGIMAAVLLGCGLLGYHVLNHLPILDFRPYAEGLSIVEGRKSAEELGKKAPEYATRYTLKNKQTGETQKMLSTRYIKEKWWTRKEWEILEDKSQTVQISEGYKPPIHDFDIQLQNREITDSVLAEDAILLVVSYKLKKAHAAAFPSLVKFTQAARKAQFPVLGLTASLPSVKRAMRKKHQLNFPLATMDETTLKTIVRSNPGLVLLQDGVVVKKWHYQDFPDFATFQKEYR